MKRFPSKVQGFYGKVFARSDIGSYAQEDLSSKNIQRFVLCTQSISQSIAGLVRQFYRLQVKVGKISFREMPYFREYATF